MSSDFDVFEAIGFKTPDDPNLKPLIGYYIALGAFLHAWAFWEYILDLCAAIIYMRSPAGKTIEKKRPVISLQAKIRYFRKAHASIEELKPYATMAESIANSYEKMGWFRHTVIHSAQGFTDSPLSRQFRKMMPADDILLEQHLTVSHSDIIESAKLISRMLAPTQKYAELLMKVFPKVPIAGRNNPQEAAK
jgi:hypothetical protein